VYYICFILYFSLYSTQRRCLTWKKKPSVGFIWLRILPSLFHRVCL